MSLFMYSSVNGSPEDLLNHELKTTAMVNKHSVSLDTVQSMCKKLYEQAMHETEDPFEPELIIGLCRGGLVPLCFLAGDGMFNNRQVRTISIASYNDQGSQGQLSLVVPWGAEDVAYVKKFKSILIVDDLVDSGATISFVKNMVQKHAPEAIIKTAALFYKPSSQVKPDYYVEETNDWIIFPWEV